MELNPQAFREYDIRGVVGEDLSADFARLLGRVYAQSLGDENNLPVSIGWDCRLSSPEYARALAEGISSTGRPVQLLGMGATPHPWGKLSLLSGFAASADNHPSHNPQRRVLLDG